MARSKRGLLRRQLGDLLAIGKRYGSHCRTGYYANPPRSFQVYFAFGSTALTQQDEATLFDAGAYATTRPGTRVRILGNADAPGAPEGNALISQRRSEVVANALNRYGVLRERMTLEAFGDTRPVVVTNPGAMQPENRRVDILIY